MFVVLISCGLLLTRLYGLSAVTDTQRFHESGNSAKCTAKEVTVRDAVLALSPVSGRCEKMALLLNIDRGTVGNIEKDCHRDNECKFQRIIQAWYNGNPDASWNDLVSLLEEMEEHVIAKKIQTKYLCTNGNHNAELPSSKFPAPSSEEKITQEETSWLNNAIFVTILAGISTVLFCLLTHAWDFLWDFIKTLIFESHRFVSLKEYVKRFWHNE